MATDRVDEAYFRDRLADPSLFDLSVEVFSLSAVPVGGSRRAGSVSFGDSDMAGAAAVVLRDRDGFPNVRVEWSDSVDVCNAVRWGDDLPPAPPMDSDFAEWLEYERTCGELYGYSAAAIDAFLDRVRGMAAASDDDGLEVQADA